MRILCCGNATLDIVNQVAEYPPEDAEIRALSQRQSVGGNAANSATILYQLGHQVELAAVVADDREADMLRGLLARLGIADRHLVTQLGGRTPTSYITLSRANGSRTIIHFRDLRELALKDFENIDLKQYDWIHFEGRNTPALEAMLSRVKAAGLPCSLEVEKTREGIETLFGYPDLLMFSHHYVMEQGFDGAEGFLAMLPAFGIEISVTWGDAGAWGRDDSGRICHSPAYPPTQVIDTLAAGDVFNAGLIDAKQRGLALEPALHAACQLAGHKCGLPGLEGVAHGHSTMRGQ